MAALRLRGKLPSVLPDPFPAGASGAFHPAVDVLAVGGMDGYLYVWSRCVEDSSDHDRWTLQSPVEVEREDPVRGVAFSADGCTLVAVGSDITLLAHDGGASFEKLDRGDAKSFLKATPLTSPLTSVTVGRSDWGAELVAVGGYHA